MGFMPSLQWSTSHAVFIPAMDDEHKEIVHALTELDNGLKNGVPAAEVHKLTQVLISRIDDHFSHEERLMRATRYSSLQWHKKSHDGTRKRVAALITRIEAGDQEAGLALVEHLTSWLNDHMRLADMMLGAFLRNQQRSLFKLTLGAGAKPAGAGPWFDTAGQKFDPMATHNGR
jgi:hemerythrin-like metal-binding protein